MNRLLSISFALLTLNLLAMAPAFAGGNVIAGFTGTWKATTADGFDVVMVIGKNAKLDIEFTFSKNGKEVARGRGNSARINVIDLMFPREIDPNTEPPIKSNVLCKVTKKGETLELSFLSPADRKTPKEVYTRVVEVVAKVDPKKKAEPVKPALASVTEIRADNAPECGGDLSPDGKRIAICKNEDLVIYDAGGGELHRFPLGGSGRAVAWSADGKSFALVQSNRAAGVGIAQPLTVFDTATWKPKVTFFLPASPARRIDLSADGKVVAVCTGRSGNNGFIKAFSVTSKRELLSAVDNQEKPAIELTSDGKILATTAFGGIALIDLASQKPVLTLKDNATSMALSPDNNQIAYATDSKIELFDRKQKKVVQSIAVDNWTPTWLAFTNQPKQLAAIGREHDSVYLYDLSTGQETFKATVKDFNPFHTLRAARDVPQLLTVGRTNTNLWSIPVKKE